MSERVMIAMSGGVDSSLAAAMMMESGYDCIGATMLLGENDDAAKEAESVALSLGIPFYTFDFSAEFRKTVVDGFVNAYENGSTPNPCVVCNRYLKFGRLMDEAVKLGCDRLATGHYARLEYDNDSGRYLLKKGADTGKDQSYFLYGLTQDQLKHIRFPLGGMAKSDVRRIARERGLVSADRQESQDICFIPDGNYVDFIESYTGKKFPGGDFIDSNGNVLGKHDGIIRYTVGQRKGLGIAFGEPVYVLGVDPVCNTVTLGPNEDLFADTLTASGLNLISVDCIEGSMRLNAKIRSRQAEQPAVVEQPDDDTILVRFDEPQRAVTPGQSVVLYDGDVVVGGAAIMPIG